MMLLHTLPNNDEIHRYQKCIVVPFEGKRTVLSTCPLNGGYQENLTAVFNNDGNPGAGMACTLRAKTYEEHMAIIASEIGLDSATVTGMTTAACMDNVSIKTESFDNTTVTAVVTGGIKTNAGRAGDPASWHEENGNSKEIKLGTINIMLFISTNLTAGTLARALVTCTEAKTAAIQELLAPSQYSMGLATGSGTDSTIVICDATSSITLSNAGKHSKLGELIGKSVIAAVKEALSLQSDLNPKSQHNILRRVDRFGITEESLWGSYKSAEGKLSRPKFSDKLHHFIVEDVYVTYTSLYAHLIDQLNWELISPLEAIRAGRKLLAIMENQHDKRKDIAIENDKNKAIFQMIEEYTEAIIKLIMNKAK